MTKATEGQLGHSRGPRLLRREAQGRRFGVAPLVKDIGDRCAPDPSVPGLFPRSRGCQQPLVSLGLWPQHSGLCLDGHMAFPPAASSLLARTAAVLARGPPRSSVASS